MLSNIVAIASFGDKRTEKIWLGRRVPKLPAPLYQKAQRRLSYIEAAETLDDLRIPPSNRLEKKKGDLKEFYSIRVNSQWRIIFRWVDGKAEDVEFVDYHR